MLDPRPDSLKIACALLHVTNVLSTMLNKSVEEASHVRYTMEEKYLGYVFLVYGPGTFQTDLL